MAALLLGACAGPGPEASAPGAAPEPTAPPGPDATPAAPASTDPSAWAEPVVLPGVPNLHRVSAGLYRSAQPSAEGMQQLAALGVRTVVNLRSFHSDRDEIGDTGLAYEHLYMKAWHPEWKEALRFLQIASDPARQPVLVHCQHGADRTGTLVAVYRMAVQGWSADQAIAEMTEGDFGYHPLWVNLPAWLRDLDVPALREEAGLAGAPGAGG